MINDVVQWIRALPLSAIHQPLKPRKMVEYARTLSDSDRILTMRTPAEEQES